MEGLKNSDETRDDPEIQKIVMEYQIKWIAFSLWKTRMSLKKY